MKKGDKVLVKTREELIETGYTNEEVNRREQFLGKFAVIGESIESFSIEFYSFIGDKNNLRWYNDMLKDDTIGYMSDRIKCFCDMCIHKCLEKDCPLFDIKKSLE